MKICIISTNLRFGGAERVAATLANGFYDHGHEVVIITNLFEKISYPLRDGITTTNLVSTNNNKIKKWSSAFKLARTAAKTYQPDVIIGIMELSSFIAKLSTIGLGTPVIASDHYSFERPKNVSYSFSEKLFKFHINKIYNTVTVLTEADKKVIGNRFKNVTVMPNPLFLETVKEIPKKEKVILAAGRIDGWYVKGFDVLIKAFAKLQGISSEWRLQIAGTGSDKNIAYLKELCIENKVEDSVDFLGFVNDMKSLYQKAAIFVLSSRYEGFGLVLIEAMSQGCAPIACDYKGRQREIIQDESQGLICLPDDVEALAQCMRKMIENSDYRVSVSQKAVKRSEHYSINNIIEKWEILLEQVV
jgi:glycosyltransferase involved in cell wall biosynthesis